MFGLPNILQFLKLKTYAAGFLVASNAVASIFSVTALTPHASLSIFSSSSKYLEIDLYLALDL
jgi:hypothetical protein